MKRGRLRAGVLLISQYSGVSQNVLAVSGDIYIFVIYVVVVVVVVLCPSNLAPSSVFYLALFPSVRPMQLLHGPWPLHRPHPS